ncbi:MAG: hypothetical protein DME19_09530 [Verrucomicrobia bacterium]|nr:MAG: hypothetical protein DME19_09530 [Verrucomicrobiota bacterium]
MRFKTFLLVSVLLFCATAAHAEFRAGVAIRVVTPDPLLPVSGGVGPSNKVSKKEGDLTVRALVLAEGNTAVAIVSADFLGFPSVLGNKARAKVKDIPPQNVLIGATHTHSAPDCYGFADHDGRVSTDLKYLDFVCNQIADAVNEANARLRPASLKIATAETKGKIAFNAYAEQLYDPRCHVIQAIGADGRPFATLVNYAVHPEVLGPDAGILSPDLVGPLYQRIHEKGGGTGIFMNSAQGGMVTADNRGPDGKSIRAWPECERIGNLLADEALRIVASAPEQKAPKLFCAARSITFPVDSPLLRAVMMSSPLHYAGNDTNRVTTQLNLVNVGNAQILTIPGEALPNIGYYLKRKMRGEHNLLFGLTNDAFGYILTKVDWNSFKRYDYVSRTSLGEMTGEIYIDEALKLVQESLASERLAP